MRRSELAFTSALMFVTACTAAEPIEGNHRSEVTADEHTADPITANEHAADRARDRALPRYAITELPAGPPPFASVASRAICARRAVVGTATFTSYSEPHAIVLDASGLDDLGTLGGPASHGNAGNASGAIVGASAIGTAGATHAFLYRDGAMQDLGTLGGAFSEAFAINNRGQIVGQSTLITGGDQPSHATLWDGGSPIDLGTLGGPESFARDLNNAGDIVGTSSRADQPFRAHAVVWRDRTPEELPSGALHSQAVAINEAGTIAGFVVYEPGQPYHAVIWRDGVMADLGSFGSSAFALGLNDRGSIVGMAWDALATRPHAFLYTHDTLLDLEDLADAPGWTLLQATDICNDGLIVGNGWLDGTQRGFVLTPVPLH